MATPATVTISISLESQAVVIPHIALIGDRHVFLSFVLSIGSKFTRSAAESLPPYAYPIVLLILLEPCSGGTVPKRDFCCVIRR